MKNTPPQNTPPDMRKEFRKELAALGKKKKTLVRSQARQARSIDRGINKIEIFAIREIRALKKAFAKISKGMDKEIALLTKRQAILVGRAL